MKWFSGTVAAALLASMLCAEASNPMTYQELSLRLRMGDNPQLLLRETMQRKLLAALSPQQQAALKAEGGTDSWIAALNAPAQRASPEAVAAYQTLKQQREATARATPTPAPSPARLSEAKLHEADIIRVGDRAPAFTAKTADGKQVAVAQPGAKGDLTLLTIVAPQSPVCGQELTFFEKQLWPQLSKLGVRVVALGSGATADQMEELGKNLGLHFLLAEDPEKTVTALYAKDYAPRCYVIGKTGIVKFASVGLNAKEMQRMVNVIESEPK